MVQRDGHAKKILLYIIVALRLPGITQYVRRRLLVGLIEHVRRYPVDPTIGPKVGFFGEPRATNGVRKAVAYNCNRSILLPSAATENTVVTSG